MLLLKIVLKIYAGTRLLPRSSDVAAKEVNLSVVFETMGFF